MAILMFGTLEENKMTQPNTQKKKKQCSHLIQIKRTSI